VKLRKEYSKFSIKLDATFPLVCERLLLFLLRCCCCCCHCCCCCCPLQVKLRKEYSKDNKKLGTKPKEEMFKTLNQVNHMMHMMPAPESPATGT
jgi:hypothetical protein